MFGQGLDKGNSDNCCMSKAWWLIAHFSAYRVESCNETSQSDEAKGSEDVCVGQTMLLYSYPEPTHP